MNEAGHRKRSGKEWGRRVVLHMLRNPLYVSKLRWNEVICEGNHDGIVSKLLFQKAQEILKERAEDLVGRRFHNGDERLLAGIIRCARCKSHMVGVTTHKKDRKYPYYLPMVDVFRTRGSAGDQGEP